MGHWVRSGTMTCHPDSPPTPGQHQKLLGRSPGMAGLQRAQCMNQAGAARHCRPMLTDTTSPPAGGLAGWSCDWQGLSRRKQSLPHGRSRLHWRQRSCTFHSLTAPASAPSFMRQRRMHLDSGCWGLDSLILSVQMSCRAETVILLCQFPTYAVWCSTVISDTAATASSHEAHSELADLDGCLRGQHGVHPCCQRAAALAPENAWTWQHPHDILTEHLVRQQAQHDVQVTDTPESCLSRLGFTCVSQVCGHQGGRAGCVCGDARPLQPKGV